MGGAMSRYSDLLLIARDVLTRIVGRLYDDDYDNLWESYSDLGQADWIEIVTLIKDVLPGGQHDPQFQGAYDRRAAFAAQWVREHPDEDGSWE